MLSGTKWSRNTSFIVLDSSTVLAMLASLKMTLCYLTENANVQWLVYFSPGRSTTLGHSGLLGESG